jgi:membrane protein required for beta-lactamase induction
MTFAVILIALLVERFFDWSHLRRWRWYLSYQQKIARQFSGPANLIFALNIVPLLLIVFIAEWSLKGVLFGLAEWLFQLGVFLYCLGPQNLWADTFACMNAQAQGDQQAAVDKLQSSFYAHTEKADVPSLVSATDAPSLFNQLLGQVFIAANQRIFAVIFWYLLLGPVGAVLYRALAISASKTTYKEDCQASGFERTPSQASTIVAALDWIPVRIFTCVFALGGHFVKVLSCWRKKDILGLETNDQLLTECGVAALGQEEIGPLAEGAAIKNAIGLVDRSLVIVLVVAALVVLLG